MRLMSRLARLSAAAALVAAPFVVAIDSADARGGRGGSIGSRGGKTHTAPPATNTAPGQAAPINRSITQPGQTAAAPRAGTTAAAAQQTSRFGGMKGLLLGGLIGAGLASFLGAGALASVLGFMLQMLLIGGIIMLIVAFFRNRAANRPAMATAQAGAAPAARQDNAAYRATPAGLGSGAAAVNLAQEDFNTFERLLGEVQNAYGQNDIDGLGQRVTPEMLSYFAHELDENAKNGVINDVSDAKLLQGDLAESWHEPGVEYATVAMRYSLLDATVEARTGKVVSGSKTEPQEVSEIWTFRRRTGGKPDQWELSAIQQAN